MVLRLSALTKPEHLVHDDKHVFANLFYGQNFKLFSFQQIHWKAFLVSLKGCLDE